jgi:sterol desaturase/sphingolipid hydroxylase (fatty acid hydroxylase superfamily)
MHHWIYFIDNNSGTIQALLFAAVLFVCWNIENIFGLALGYNKWTHAFLNAGFILTNIPGQLLMGLLFVKVMLWTSVNHFGLFYLLPFGRHYILLFLASFIFLDLGEYVYHVIMHKVQRLWMFHSVHHSDTIVDVSTTLREHPGENIIRLTFTLLIVFLGGIPFWTLVLRQIIQVFATLFAHMNYRLPEKTDRVIGWVLITPNMHQVHHHFRQPYTDSNYGDVLSIWDRLFGTLKKLPAEKLVFGVDGYNGKEDQRKFFSLIKRPFEMPGIGEQ